MKLYTERPKTIEAMQYDGTEKMALEIASRENFEGMVDYRQKKFFALWINTGGRELRMDKGDYLIQDWNGEYDMLPEKIFKKMYKELV